MAEPLRFDRHARVCRRTQPRPAAKLGGIVGWYFYYVMHSLPLMLQTTMLLLGCALPRYLWDIDVTVASVVLSVTSFGVIFYLSVVIAGTASESCPYQTPAAHSFRQILRCLLPAPRSACPAILGVISSAFFRLFWSCSMLAAWFSNLWEPWYSLKNLPALSSSFLYCLYSRHSPTLRSHSLQKPTGSHRHILYPTG